MAKARHIRKLGREDIPEAPDWMERVQTVYNPLCEQQTTLFVNGLDIVNNFDSETITVSVTHDEEFTQTLRRVKWRPRIIIPGFADGHLITAAGIVGYPEPGKVTIKVLFDGAPSDPVTVTLYVLGIPEV
jgi:hypothetical protein